MINFNKTVLASTIIAGFYPSILLAETCGSTPSCPSLGFTVAKSNLATECKDKTSLKCPFSDYYFCSQVDDGCPTFVEVDYSTEVCQTLCPKNSSKCLQKRTVSCSEAIRNVGGKLLTPSDGFCGTRTETYYLTGPITSNCSSTLVGTSVHSAQNFASCKSEMKGTPSLILSDVTIDNYASFNVPVTINNMSFRNDQGGVSFGANVDVKKINGYAQSGWIKDINIAVVGSAPSGSVVATAKFGLACGCMDSSSSYSKPTCEFAIDGINADITYYRTSPDMGRNSCLSNIKCGKSHDGYGSCKETSGLHGDS